MTRRQPGIEQRTVCVCVCLCVSVCQTTQSRQTHPTRPKSTHTPKPASQSHSVPEEREILWRTAIHEVLIALEADNLIAIRTLNDGATLNHSNFIDLKTVTCIMSATTQWTIERIVLTSPKSLLNLVGTACERIEDFATGPDDNIMSRLKHFSRQLLQASARYGGWPDPAPTVPIYTKIPDT